MGENTVSVLQSNESQIAIRVILFRRCKLPGETRSCPGINGCSLWCLRSWWLCLPKLIFSINKPVSNHIKSMLQISSNINLLTLINIRVELNYSNKID